MFQVTDPAEDVKEIRVEEEEVDIPLVEADHEFFAEGGRGQSFADIDLDYK